MMLHTLKRKQPYSQGHVASPAANNTNRPTPMRKRTTGRTRRSNCEPASADKTKKRTTVRYSRGNTHHVTKVHQGTATDADASSKTQASTVTTIAPASTLRVRKKPYAKPSGSAGTTPPTTAIKAIAVRPAKGMNQPTTSPDKKMRDPPTQANSAKANANPPSVCFTRNIAA